MQDGIAAGDRQGLAAHLRILLDEEVPLLAEGDAERAVDVLLRDLVGFGPLEDLMADPAVTEIMLNGPGPVWVERDGVLECLPLTVDGPAIERLVERVVRPLGLRWDRSAPIADARLADGSRLHAVMPPLAVDGPYVTIRRFAARTIGIDAFAAPDVRRLVEWAVRAGWNLVVSGGTSSGKTTLLNALSAAIPPGERVVTVEETAELRLQRRHVLRLEARPANGEGRGEVSLRDLVRAALRMRPDRIVVGEVRGPEALDMVEALNTGHDGSMSTVHANGPDEALLRLETLALRGAPGLGIEAVRAHVRGSLDAVVHVRRDGAGRRSVDAVSEIDSAGRQGVRPLVVGGALVAEPSRPPRLPGAAWAP